MRKPRSDSKLKTLPAERQAQIVEWLETPKSDASPGGIALALEQLAADGLKTSAAALSDFYSWWRLQRDFEEAESHAQEFKDLLKGSNLALTTGQLEAAGNLIFTKEALKNRDGKGFQDIQYLRLAQDTAKSRAALEEKKIQLAERRVKVAERKLEQLKGALSDESLTAEQKEQKMKAVFGL